MAERLQPRTAAFRLQFEDVTVTMDPGETTADVHLTAEFIRRSITTGEESLDAREFSLGMQKVGGEWRIARVTAIDTSEIAIRCWTSAVSALDDGRYGVEGWRRRPLISSCGATGAAR